MLTFIRTHQRAVQIALILIGLPSFLMVGIHGLQSGDDSQNIASINGKGITRQEFDGTVRSQIERLSQMVKGTDSASLDTPELRKNILDSLIQERLLDQKISKDRLAVTDEQVRENILEIPQIQSLKKPDGQIDLEAYKQLLDNAGMTPEQFDTKIRDSLLKRQIPESIMKSVIVPKTTATKLFAFQTEQREVQALSLFPKDYIKTVAEPSEQDLNTFYKNNQTLFQIPEAAQIQYILLDPQKLPAPATPTDKELKSFYTENIAQFTTPEQRKVSHILIAVPDNASATDKAKLKAKAENLLTQLKQHPDQFAKLAAANSQDPGSAKQGGDLGFIGRGTTVKPFEDTVFGLKKGETSTVITTSFGYHIIKVTDIRPAVVQTFEKVKQSLRAEYLKDQHQKQIAAATTQFTKLTYDSPTSLKETANSLGLPILNTQVSRTQNPLLDTDNPLNNKKLLHAIFSDDVLRNGRNTNAIDVGNGILIAARLLKYQPATTATFSAIKGKVRDALILDKAAQLAKNQGEKLLADLKKGTTIKEVFGAPKFIAQQAPSVPEASLHAIFSANPQVLPSYAAANLGKQGYVIYKINKIKKGDLPNQETLAMFNDPQMQAEFDAYIAGLKEQAKIKINTGNVFKRGG